MYNEWDSFKLNDMLEVFGILSVDPALSMVAEDKYGFCLFKTIRLKISI